jgi:hypothetical protein
MIIVGLDSQSIIQLKLMLKRDKEDEQGYDAIKMYGFVNPEMFKTTIEIAKKYNILLLDIFL